MANKFVVDSKISSIPKEIKIDRSRCSRCGICVAVCRKSALVIYEELIYKRDKCIGCGDCIKVCGVYVLSEE